MPFQLSSFAYTPHCTDRHRMVDSQSFCKCPYIYYFFYPFFLKFDTPYVFFFNWIFVKL